MEKLKIFSGTANLKLSQNIASQLGVDLGQIEIRNFSDSEIFVKIKESVRGKDVFVIQPTSNPGHYNILELLIIIDALRRASAGRITAVIPYFGYARQDRKDQPRVALSSKLMANLITVSGANRILTMDLHAAQIQGFFDIPVDHLAAVPVFENYIKNMRAYKDDNLVIVSPDTGGVARARNLASRINANLAIIDKRRPKSNVAEVMNIIGEVEGKDLIILDDMIDTAGTLAKGADALFEHGAKSVTAFATHGVFSGKAFENIKKSKINKVLVTDTIFHEFDENSKIEILSVASLFSMAIARIHEEESVGALFE